MPFANSAYFDPTAIWFRSCQETDDLEGTASEGKRRGGREMGGMDVSREVDQNLLGKFLNCFVLMLF